MPRERVAIKIIHAENIGDFRCVNQKERNGSEVRTKVSKKKVDD